MMERMSKPVEMSVSRPTEISTSLDILQGKIIALHVSKDALAEKIASILRPNAPQSEKGLVESEKGLVPECSTGLAKRITESIRGIDSAVHDITDIINRCEL